MNTYDIRDFFLRLYPGKSIVCSFDQNCIQQIEVTYTTGEVSSTHFIQYNKQAVSVNGDPVFYIPIDQHREVISVLDPFILNMQQSINDSMSVAQKAAEQAALAEQIAADAIIAQQKSASIEESPPSE